MQGQWERKWARSPLQERYALRFYDRQTGDRLEPVVLGYEHGTPAGIDNVVWAVTAPMTPIAPPTSRRRRSQPIETDRPIIDRSTDIMGDYWSWAVLSAAYFRLRRFDEIHAALGVATNILADRLSRLVLHGVLERKPYQDAPVRYEYRLTEAGRDMYPIVLAMHGWSERWLYPDESPPLRLKSRTTGEILSPVVCDRSTGQAIDPRRVRWEVEREAAPEGGAP
jgi:DNA-binding HxlR family transcriptional regulator